MKIIEDLIESEHHRFVDSVQLTRFTTSWQAVDRYHTFLTTILDREVSGAGSADCNLLAHDLVARRCAPWHGVFVQSQSIQRRHLAGDVERDCGWQPEIVRTGVQESATNAARQCSVPFSRASHRSTDVTAIPQIVMW